MGMSRLIIRKISELSATDVKKLRDAIGQLSEKINVAIHDLIIDI